MGKNSKVSDEGGETEDEDELEEEDCAPKVLQLPLVSQSISMTLASLTTSSERKLKLLASDTPAESVGQEHGGTSNGSRGESSKSNNTESRSPSSGGSQDNSS
jgi:hypothetical protein